MCNNPPFVLSTFQLLMQTMKYAAIKLGTLFSISLTNCSLNIHFRICFTTYKTMFLLENAKLKSFIKRSGQPLVKAMKGNKTTLLFNWDLVFLLSGDNYTLFCLFCSAHFVSYTFCVLLFLCMFRLPYTTVLLSSRKLLVRRHLFNIYGKRTQY